MSDALLYSPPRQVTSLPPVKLYVGKIPQNLTQQGLRNWFGKFGDLVEVYLNRNPSSSHNFGFVTYYSREAAGRAICETNNRPPLNLSVNYSRKSEAREQELQKKLQEICDIKPVDNEEELEDDWDTEIQKEEQMIASLDKFKEDYSSGDDEIPVDRVKRLPLVPEVKEEKDPDDINPTKADANAHSSKNETSKKPPCKRCGLESKFVCKGCSSERYCSAACQSLEWSLHRKSCNIKPDLKTKDSSKQEIIVTAEIHKEDSHSPVNVDSVSRITPETRTTDNSAVSLDESSKSPTLENEENRDLTTLRNQLEKSNIGDSNSKPFPTNSDNSFSPRPTSPRADQNRVYFEKDLAESEIDLWSEDTKVLLLEVEGHWALVKPIRRGNQTKFQIFHNISIYFYLYFMLDAHSHILEKVLEGAQLTSLEEPAEGQICLIRVGSSRVRVVIDKMFNDGRLGVHGLDQVI